MSEKPQKEQPSTKEQEQPVANLEDKVSTEDAAKVKGGAAGSARARAF